MPADKQTSKAAQPASDVRLVTVGADSVDRRLDNFLLTELKGLPRTRIYRLIRTGEVRVNKGRVKPAYRLAAGDVVRIPPVRGLRDGAAVLAAPKVAWINDCVVYEDEYLLVINKPSGLAVHGGSGISHGAIELLRSARPDSRYLELVHRLDKDTSGCLLIAKKRSALRQLHDLFREGQVRKIYLALLKGQWAGGMQEISLPLVTEHRKGGERHVRVGEDGKPALTRVFPQEQFVDAVLARIELLTGRTHQIRVHAAAIGHPVAGDERYGPTPWRPFGLRRLFLHAHRLEFAHPNTAARVRVEVPLDDSLLEVLECFRHPDRAAGV
jgi:23S rRNA pseudouridine955/2504/2580 synthase